MSSKRSSIWSFFTAGPKDIKAKCNKCGAFISRGSKEPSKFTTTNLANHLKCHPDVLADFKQAKQAKSETEKEHGAESGSSSSGSGQQTLAPALDRSKLWDINSSKATAVHVKIAEMIASDCQPYSIVEDTGFRRLIHTLEPRYNMPSRKYISQTIMPQVLARVKEHVTEGLGQLPPKGICLTTDIWTSDANNQAFISLTACGITIDCKRRTYVLAVRHFPTDHNAANICAILLGILAEWEVDKSDVHLALRDNARNMDNGLTQSGIEGIGCAAHTLALAVKESIASQRAVSDLIVNVRKICTHFHHSSKATTALNVLQQSNNLPQQKLIQDVPTRWNSSYYMLRSVSEKKAAIVGYASEHTAIPTLNAHSWQLMEKIIDVLGPMEKITQKFSSDRACVSSIATGISGALTLLRGKEAAGVGTMRDTLVNAIEHRFDYAFENNICTVAELLDPRFKTSNLRMPNDVRDYIVAECASPEPSPSRTDAAGHSVAAPTTEDNTTMDPWTVFSQTASSSDQLPVARCSSVSAATELANYLAEPRQGVNIDPLDWWKVNNKRFPKLFTVARRYLAAPLTSVRSERLFSIAGGVLTDNRNRLSADNAEALIFLHDNLRMMD